MDLSNIRLVVSDMDGTLLNSNKEISQNLHRILDKLERKNILFAVASGRQYFSLLERLKTVKSNIIYIAENGAIIMHNGEQKHMESMKPEMVQKVISEIRELGGKYIILSGRKRAYIESTDPEFMEQFLRHYDKYKVVEDVTQVKNDDFLKVTACDLSGAEENTLPHVKHFNEELQVKLSGEIWVDFTHREAQKGNALRKVQEIFGIEKENTMAFGDYFNDLELFDLAEYTFAMENAREEVKSAAKYLTRSNDDQGVEKILEKLLQDCKS